MTLGRKLSILILALAAIGLSCGAVMAHPLDGQFLKFQQLPMEKTTINGMDYYGHDEPSTLWSEVPGEPLYYGTYMADDFADRVSARVVHVRWWGSYPDSIAGAAGVNRFLISFEEDLPAGTPYPDGNICEWSRPGEPILTQVVKRGPLSPGSGTFEENSVNAGGPPLDEKLYEYNAELLCPFFQEADTVYWLKIAALVDQEDEIMWGWHNRDYTHQNTLASGAILPYGEHVQGKIPDPTGTNDPTLIWHFQDDAIMGDMEALIELDGHPCQVEIYQDPWGMDPANYWDDVDGPGPFSASPEAFRGIGHYSKDLAFELYAVPEPSTLVLLGIGLVSLVGYGWRRRSV